MDIMKPEIDAIMAYLNEWQSQDDFDQRFPYFRRNERFIPVCGDMPISLAGNLFNGIGGGKDIALLQQLIARDMVEQKKVDGIFYYRAKNPTPTSEKEGV
jgi:hypothetical protein